MKYRMKKFFLTLCAITVIFFAMAAAAEAGNGLYTVITGRDGSTQTIDGIAEAGSDAKGYEIWYDGEKLLTVTQSNRDSDGISLFGTETVQNGYYSVEFAVSETESAFIAGLTRANKDDVQNALIGAAYSQKEIDLESLDFIDAEKVRLRDQGDNLLCWAGAASNTLTYTGWGKKAGFESEDDLFDHIADNFTDANGNAYFVWTWFIDGIYRYQIMENLSHVRELGKTGNYFPEYSSDRQIDVTTSPGRDIRNVTDYLRGGAGVTLDIIWLRDGVNTGGHGVTLWGYICDKRYETEKKDDPAYIKAFIFSDSDSDRVSDERRMAPNKLHICHAERFTGYGYDTWRLDTYYNGIGVVHDICILKPYSDDREKETAPEATLNAVTTPNLLVIGADIKSGMVPNTVFSVDDVISVAPYVQNWSHADFSGNIGYSVVINSRTYRESFYADIQKYSSIYAANPIELANLPAGEYDVKITVNPDKAVSEAYYYDNTYSRRITVVDDVPDTDDTGMTAVISEQKGDKFDVSFEYENTDAIFSYMGEGCVSAVYASFYEDGLWKEWELLAYDEDCMGSFPDSCELPINGTKVKFMGLVYNEGKPAVMACFSDDYRLNYIRLTIDKTDGNTGVYSPLPENASALSEGEKLSFSVKNASSYDTGAIAADVALLAYNETSGETVTIYEAENVPLGYGEAPYVTEISSWPAELALTGTYRIFAYFESEYAEDQIELGTVRIREHASTIVDTDADIYDEYDGRTSLREAVAACGADDVITNTGFIILYINSTIPIDKPVKIDFGYGNPGGSEYENPYGIGFGTAIHGGDSCRIFKVTEGGYLDVRGTSFVYAMTKENGGAILVDGGDAMLTGCRVFKCKSNRAGGGIYVNDGKLTLKNCYFKRNESGYGGAIAASDTGSIDMLDCTVFMNTSNVGAIYTSGTLAAINSTFAENTAKSTGASAVTATGLANAALVNCIAVDDNAVNGNVKVYGCILGNTAYAGEAHGSKLGVAKNELFKTDEYGDIVWDAYGGWDCIHYIPFLSKTAEMPASVVSIKGIIALSDGENTEMTGISAAFSDEELSRDALGNESGGFCGNIKNKIGDTGLVLSEDGVTVYTYEGGDAALIGAYYDGAGGMEDMEILGSSLGNGTNFIPADTEGNCKFMLWDSPETMKPIASSVGNIEQSS